MPISHHGEGGIAERTEDIENTEGALCVGCGRQKGLSDGQVVEKCSIP